MKTPKFKKGDQVRIIPDHSNTIYTVRLILHKTKGLTLLRNKFFYGLERDGIGASADEEQLVKV